MCGYRFSVWRFVVILLGSAHSSYSLGAARLRSIDLCDDLYRTAKEVSGKGRQSKRSTRYYNILEINHS